MIHLSVRAMLFNLLWIIRENLSIFEVQLYIVNMNDGDHIDYDSITDGSVEVGISIQGRIQDFGKLLMYLQMSTDQWNHLNQPRRFS